ncbi:hypothetical protein TWF730_010984 [Orbilia blumenaviensis]|uniref:Uncharacterized protein n=1 Tax=Orbilia blumenaviensis TaxID=1796055 RepID=A0AAV9ULB9_9PEZI
MYYPWYEPLTAWATNLNVEIDALGLVTMLGAKEVDLAIGRLVSSSYFDFLPLLGAFVIADNSFAERRTGFTLYNITNSLITTDVAPWLSRWVKAQRFETARMEIIWDVFDNRPSQWVDFILGLLLVGIPLNGMLIAMTVLSKDWWGFANALSMVFSILVRIVLASACRKGIDANIKKAFNSKAEAEAKKERSAATSRPTSSKVSSTINRDSDLQIPLLEGSRVGQADQSIKYAKVLIVTDDSCLVSMAINKDLARNVLAIDPEIQNPGFYNFLRWVGWAAFAVHVISLSMAALHTQIYTVVLLIGSTILAASHIGCDDYKIGESPIDFEERSGGSHTGSGTEGSHTGPSDAEAGAADGGSRLYSRECWITSRLRATVIKHPPGSTRVQALPKTVEERPENTTQRWPSFRGPASKSSNQRKLESRNILYLRLGLDDREDKLLAEWGLIPRDKKWQEGYLAQKQMRPA